MRNVLHILPTAGAGGAVERRLAAIARATTGELQHTMFYLDRAAGRRPVPVGEGEVSVLAPALLDAARPSALLAELKPALLVTYGWPGLGWVLAAQGRVPHIHVESHVGLEELAGPDHPRAMMRRQVLTANGSTLIVPSRALRRAAVRIWGLPEPAVRYIPNGISLPRAGTVPCAEAVTRLGIGPEELVIGTFGPLHRERGVHRLLRAMTGLSVPARMVVIGDGPARPELEKAARQLGLGDRVLFTGNYWRPDRVIGRFDLFALADDTVQMPHSLMEAMRAGCAIVAPAVGDIGAMVAPENRPFIVPPGDTAATGRAMDLLLRQPALRRRIGRANALHAMDAFPLDRTVAQYSGLFLRRAAPAGRGVVAA